MKKSIVGSILVLCMLLGIVSQNNVWASDVSKVFLNAEHDEVTVNEEFSVVLRAENIKSLYSFSAVIEYEGNVISFLNATTSLDGFFLSPVTKDNTSCKIVFTKMGSIAEEKGDINLCTLKFKALKSSSCKITLKSMEILDGSLKDTVFGGVGSSLTIEVTNEGAAPDPTPTTTPTPIPTPTSTPTPTPTQSPNDFSSIKLEEKPDENGSINTEVKTDELQKVISNINGGVVQIEVKAAEEAREVNLNIPLKPLYELEKKQMPDIAVTLGPVNISLNTDILRKDMGQEPDKLQLSVLKVDKDALSEEIKERVGDNTVYNFSMKVDGNQVGTFRPGAVSIALPYVLKPGEKTGNIIVYYIGENGNLEVVKNGKYDSATGKVVFTPRHFSKYTAVYKNVTFTDLADTPWAMESIEALAARGSINGVGNGVFKPEDKITRSQFIKALMLALDLTDDNAKSSLTDVQESEWYYSSIASAEKLGIVKGKEDGSFGIDDEITRQDMAVMAYRAAQEVKVTLNGKSDRKKFTDEVEIATYAIKATVAMQEEGVLQGLENGRFAPLENATRAQAVVMLYRLYNIIK